MKEYFRPSLLAARKQLGNYGHREPAECDLSLISGPFIWEQEARKALQSDSVQTLSGYALPGQNPQLIATLSQYEGIDPQCIRLTAGADLGLEIVLRQLLGAGDHLAVLCPNFPRFALVSSSIEAVTFSRHLHPDDLPKEGVRLIAVCTPNNPTTEEMPRQVLEKIITDHPNTMICIDGVFDWYGSYDLASLCLDYPNVILLKSFSKIGLAGLRLGYMISSHFNMELLGLGQSPFSVPQIIQKIGLEVAKNFSRIDELQQMLSQGWDQIHSALGNAVVRQSPVPFYLLKTNRDSAEAVDMLAAEGISVVDSIYFHGLGSDVARIAIGTHEQNDRLIRAVQKLEII
ncbi:MAG: aminotransferase class I/II-fold pyridoxal phosphate-dependent enzyme [bacterium]|nr:aminotransferase class I/II-fold pyridoxal phosphate-dependent enzyme [bacterium]